MSQQKPPSELRQALTTLRPYFVRASWFSLVGSLLLLAPTGYMLEVYDRVVNSRSHMTLFMLTVLVLGVYAVMEVLDWSRNEILRGPINFAYTCIINHYFYLCKKSGKMGYCNGTFKEVIRTHENKCNQKRTGWDTARPRRQHRHLIGQPIFRPLPADARCSAHRHPVGDAFGQYAFEPAWIEPRNEIF